MTDLPGGPAGANRNRRRLKIGRTSMLTSGPVPRLDSYHGAAAEMKTGELARQAGVNIQTIRFYEREGLLALPPRTAAGYRCYGCHDLERVVFIKTCQQLGFTLSDIRSLAEVHRPLERAASRRTALVERSRIAAIAQDRLRQVDEKLRQLSEMRAHLQSVCDSCRSDSEPRCPASRLSK